MILSLFQLAWWEFVDGKYRNIAIEDTIEMKILTGYLFIIDDDDGLKYEQS